MDNKEKYRLLCETEESIPLFSQHWWMDSVCGSENWDVHLIEKGGATIAAMPYYFTTRNNQKIITKAMLTQNNGIWIKYPSNIKYNSKLDYEEKIINEICDFLEEFGIEKYEQQYHYSFTNWLPFFWRGYSEITRYTYVIENTENIYEVEANFSSEARKNLRKAQKIVTLSENISLEHFYRINKLSFDRQNISIPYSFDFFERLGNECIKRNCCKFLSAQDYENNIHSVAMIVWDNDSVYYLLNGTDPQFKSSQANAFLIYEGIKIASKLNKKFDFEGSVIKPIEKAFRQYGGMLKPYFRIYKEFN